MKADVEERNAEMIRLRVKEHWTLQALGDKYGISRERVRQIVPVIKPIPSFKAEANREAVLKLRRENPDIKALEIAKKLGLSSEYVHHLVTVSGAPRRVTLMQLLKQGKLRCWRCRKIMPLKKFGTSKGEKTGYNKACKLCNADNVKQVRIRQIEQGTRKKRKCSVCGDEALYDTSRCSKHNQIYQREWRKRRNEQLKEVEQK